MTLSKDVLAEPLEFQFFSEWMRASFEGGVVKFRSERGGHLSQRNAILCEYIDPLLARHAEMLRAEFEKENAELRSALETIAGFPGDHEGAEFITMRSIARKALKEPHV